MSTPEERLAADADERFERSLTAVDPVTELRTFAKELSGRGLGKRAIYRVFLAYAKRLRASDREYEEHLLGEVMDAIVDEYSVNNLYLPD